MQVGVNLYVKGECLGDEKSFDASILQNNVWLMYFIEFF